MAKHFKRGLLIVLILALGGGAYLYWRTPFGGAVSYLTAAHQSLAGSVTQMVLPAPVDGPTAGQAEPIHFALYLPKGYDESTRTYATLYHLHGLMQVSEAFALHYIAFDIDRIARTMEKAVAAGTIEPLIIVAPYDGSGASMWSDQRAGGVRAETALHDRLVPHIDSTYRTAGGPRSRAVQGFSMGGFGAVKMALKFPETFSAAVSYDGAIHDWESLTGKRPAIADSVFGGDPAYFEQFGPLSLAPDSHMKAPVFKSNVGQFKPYNRKLKSHLSQLGLRHDYVEVDCLHDFDCLLRKTGAESFRFLDAAFAAPPTE